MIIFPNQSSWSGPGWCGITAESGQFQVEKIANYGDFFPCPIFSLCVSVLSVKNAPFDMARSITVRLRISRKKSCNSIRKSRVKFYHTSPLEGTHIELHISKTCHWTKISQKKPNRQNIKIHFWINKQMPILNFFVGCFTKIVNNSLPSLPTHLLFNSYVYISDKLSIVPQWTKWEKCQWVRSIKA